jgi:hypothetical protein
MGGEEANVPEGVLRFGRTFLMAAADYNESLMTRMFLDAGEAPLGREVYESTGRRAIQFLIEPGDEDAVRRRPAIDDKLWHRMKETGQPGFPSLFPGVSSPLVGAITADFSMIQWWAEAMQRTAHHVAKVRGWQAHNPGAKMDDPELGKLRQELVRHLRDLAKNMREEFGYPWGLIAINQLADHTAGAKILITGPKLVRNNHRAILPASEPS